MKDAYRDAYRYRDDSLIRGTALASANRKIADLEREAELQATLRRANNALLAYDIGVVLELYMPQGEGRSMDRIRGFLEVYTDAS